jgi:hypothetical protein
MPPSRRPAVGARKESVAMKFATRDRNPMPQATAEAEAIQLETP